MKEWVVVRYGFWTGAPIFEEREVPEPETITLNISPRELANRMMKKMAEEGTEFRKCANCGDIYPLGTPTDEEGEFWTNETVCGERCYSAFLAHLNNPDY